MNIELRNSAAAFFILSFFCDGAGGVRYQAYSHQLGLRVTFGGFHDRMCEIGGYLNNAIYRSAINRYVTCI